MKDRTHGNIKRFTDPVRFTISVTIYGFRLRKEKTIFGFIRTELSITTKATTISSNFPNPDIVSSNFSAEKHFFCSKSLLQKKLTSNRYHTGFCLDFNIMPWQTAPVMSIMVAAFTATGLMMPAFDRALNGRVRAHQ